VVGQKIDLNTGTTTGIDYLAFKKASGLKLIPDSIKILQGQFILDSLADFEIINGQKEFCYDRGWTYYCSFIKWKKLSDGEMAQQYWERGWRDFQDPLALWNLANAAKILGNCKKALDLTEEYVRLFPEDAKNQYDQLYFRYKNCRGY